MAVSTRDPGGERTRQSVARRRAHETERCEFQVLEVQVLKGMLAKA